MRAIHTPRPSGAVDRMLEVFHGLFWVFDLAFIGMFAFLIVLGAFNPADSAGATVAFVALVVLWVAHVLVRHRHDAESLQDPRLRHARERRGF